LSSRNHAILIYKEGLRAIDLKSLNSKLIVFKSNANLDSLKIEKGFQCARINKNEYCYFRGEGSWIVPPDRRPPSWPCLPSMPRPPQSAVVDPPRPSNPNDFKMHIVDLNSQTVKSFTRVDQMCGASIYKEGRIYLFGGSKNNSSYYFDLGQQNWKSISSSPKDGGWSTACLVGNTILITGYNYNGLYSYDDKTNQYALVNSNIEGKAKYAMHGWIISDAKKLYKIDETKRYNCQSFSVNVAIEYDLLIYSSFLYNNFIYFLYNTDQLYRINRRKSTIEIVSITHI
jgi:hypothetical protein